MKPEKQVTPSNPAVGSSARFGSPQAVLGMERVLGGDMDELLPPWETIPAEYKSSHNKWAQLISRWFFSGLPKETRFIAKPGIDEKAAKAHLRAILVSFQPKHEHKEAGCAYLLSRWFEDVIVPNDQAEPQPPKGKDQR